MRFEAFNTDHPKIIYAGQFLYLVIVSITKLSILLFYYRLFGTPGTHQVFKMLLKITQALVVLWFVASVIPGTFRCHRIDDMWNPIIVSSANERHYCISNSAYYISTAASDVALDVWILVLPLSIVWTLQLSGKRKAGLSAIFLLGGLYVSHALLIAVVRLSSHLCSTCVASVARAYTVANVRLSDFSCKL